MRPEHDRPDAVPQPTLLQIPRRTGIARSPRPGPDRGALLETPPDAATLKALLGKLGIGARQLLRSGEDEYKSLELANPALSDAHLIDAMVQHPKLIERPILVAGDKAVIGRPPEKVLEILP